MKRLHAFAMELAMVNGDYRDLEVKVRSYLRSSGAAQLGVPARRVVA